MPPFRPPNATWACGRISTTHLAITSDCGLIACGTFPNVTARASGPRFIDPAGGDYRLQAASIAVDFAEPVTGDDRDLDGLARDQDLPFKPNRQGPRDLGAYERGAPLPHYGPRQQAR